MKEWKPHAGKDGVRRAVHAGTWYDGRGASLGLQLDKWLEDARLDADPDEGKVAKALFAPHSGYTYGGWTAAHAFKHLQNANYRRVFVMGPSHHVYIRGCAITGTSRHDTPFGVIPVDEMVNKELYATGKFKIMKIQMDEEEHSIEMELPFLKRLSTQDFTVVPIVFGDLSDKDADEYAKILQPYFEDPANCFVVSTDFCHWGRRFRYCYYNDADGAIYESIEKLDKTAMTIIANQETAAFSSYLGEYENTICGRHAIAVMMRLIDRCGGRSAFDVSFNHYSQSSRARTFEDSSVSYASGYVLPKRAVAKNEA